MADKYYISEKGLTEKNKRVLRSFLKLLRGLQENWAFMEQGIGQVVIIDVDHKNGKQYWDDLIKHPDNPVCVAFSQHHQADSTTYTYQLDNPLHSPQLINVLRTILADQQDRSKSQAEQSLQIIDPNQEHRSSTEPINDNEQFNPDNYLTGYLAKLKQQTNSVYLVCGEGQLLYQCPKQQFFCSSNLGKLMALCRQPIDTVDKKTLNSQEITAISENMKSISYDNLRWFSSLAGSQGRLLAILEPSDIFQLSRWPDFSRLPKRSYHFRLAAFMSKNATTIEQISQNTGINENKVIDFINTCQIFGYLIIRQQVQYQEKILTKEKVGLFAHIRKRLGLG